MSDDIVTRLREWHTEWDWDLPDEAAEEIERLRAELARLSSFLHPIGMVIDGQFSSTSETAWKRDD